MALYLNLAQRKTLLESLRYRVSQFPQGALRNKLTLCDEAYHLAKIVQDADLDPTQTVNPQVYSRYQELTNALSREVGEAFATKFITTFLSKTQIFSMTSSPDRAQDAVAFNTILEDQQKNTGWRDNLSMVLLDAAKYNIGCVDVVWKERLHYQLSFSATAQSGKRLRREPVVWAGNHLLRIDPYNVFFDTSVSLQEIPQKGEFCGYSTLATQVALKELIDTLKIDKSRTLYLSDPTNPQFNLFNLSDSSSNNYTAASTGSMKHYTPATICHGMESGQLPTKENWYTVFGGSSADQSRNRHYTISKFYLRVLPESYTKSMSNPLSDSVQIWEVYVLDSCWILATKQLDCAHGLMPTIFFQTDVDSLTYNTTGPMQVSIPYQKTSKQILDRILASADRAIGDRAVYDDNYIDETVVNSRIPDPKIKMKKTLPAGKTIDSVYRQMPFNGEAIYRLLTDLGQVENAGRRAAGLNLAQTGQFVKGNKTLHEYEDVRSNADDKFFVRNLLLEATAFQPIKNILKLNIIQYQSAGKMYAPDEKMDVDINPAQLYQARVDFALADALLPTTNMISPNVQQLLLQLITTMPQLFQEYDIPRMVSHIISQSNGFNIENYKLQAPVSGP